MLAHKKAVFFLETSKDPEPWINILLKIKLTNLTIPWGEKKSVRMYQVNQSLLVDCKFQITMEVS